MADLKIPVTVNNEQALKDMLGEYEVIVDDKGKSKCVVPYTFTKNGDTIIANITDELSGECNITVAPAIDLETGDEYLELKEYTYAMELNDGQTLEVKSTYVYSVSNIVSRIFHKALASAKAKYGPVKRTSVNSEKKAKLSEERARFKLAQAKASGKTVEAAVEAVDENEDF